MRSPWLVWTPRVLGILIGLFFLLFSFDSGFTLGFLIHNIPTIIIAGLVVMGWGRPLWAGIGFLLLGIITVFWFGTWSALVGFLIVTLPMLLAGGLFLLDHLKGSGAPKHI